ncbi:MULTISPECIES: ATP-dependent DNA helicase RecG [unclassified Roseitalea]|uniref:ATP-dependent DNA helicase RecG n=1 Tax=unclassified Roseitalea TaxID=2639107 RepID=UPI00273FF7F9|nr:MULTISPECIES: ATP-dependent DNA helicase RecG [unclassified Roseitalea]
MRPSVLDPLFAPVTSLDGVGSKLAALIGQVTAYGGERDVPHIGALLFHLPHSVIDRSHRPTIMGATPGTIVTLDLHVDRFQPAPSGKSNTPARVFAHDASGEIALTFFHARRSWLERALPVGADVIVSGKVEWFNGRASMVHPDHMVLAGNAADLPLIEPVYPLTAGLSPKVLRKAILQALDRLPRLDDWLDPTVILKGEWPGFAEALRRLHNPETAADIALQSPARRRLAYDELLAGQLALAVVRRRMKVKKGRPLIGDGHLVGAVRQAFGHELTGAQQRAFDEIAADMSVSARMLRLLQGDVGSGKTIVALMALARAVEAGTQGALMAPTEVLARQHHATIAPLAERAGLRVALLTGREKGARRAQILGALASGDTDIVIGTHAVFQESVGFADLGLAIIDEQHRFGVHQRLMLARKGQAVDMLVMTATPIPRTLVLTAYGDMDVSRLDEKPAGRKPVTTIALPFTRLDTLLQRIATALARGHKAYWICPLVEDSEDLPVTSAQDRHRALAARFGSQVGLVHGRMRGADKDAAMDAFKSGRTRILVATTVIEVGVDVPDATIIVIEHAERFGLSQLHQLRGRVGRGERASTCILLYKEPLGETARARLNVMRQTEDGFVIAEEDLRLRGEGEILGTRQSGMPGFRLARLEAHGDLLATARVDARMVLDADPELGQPRGKALRPLLYLFERDTAVQLLSAG